MDRICDPFAYGEGPIETCFWNETVSIPSFDPLQGPARADVVVIGAGFSGLSAALRLAEAGRDVIVLETEQPGWGASGRNGGFCCLGGSKLSDKSLARRFGSSAVHEYRLAERDAVDFVDDFLTSRNLEVDRHSEGETILAHRRRDYAGLEAEATEVEASLGVTPTLIPQSDLARHGLNGPFFGGLTVPVGFALNPKKYVYHLVNAATSAGVRIFGNSPVLSLEGDDQKTVRLETGEVSCAEVVIATNGYSHETLPDWMASRFIPAQSSVIVTRKLTQEEQERQGWTSLQMSYDTRSLLHYFRLMPDGRFLFGMRGGLATDGRVHERIRTSIRKDFDKMFPAWSNVETPWYWSGFVCFNSKLTPFAGKLPGGNGLYAAFAYHGNGVAMGSYCGALVAEKILGRSELRHPTAISAIPQKFPGGRLRRLGMWPAYLAYALKDL